MIRWRLRSVGLLVRSGSMQRFRSWCTDRVVLGMKQVRKWCGVGLSMLWSLSSWAWFKIASQLWSLAPEYMVSPGAYWISASVSTPSGQMAQANAWVGRVPVDPPPIEVAMVWSSILGVHWDPDGRLVDGALEALVVPNADAPGSLYALFALPERFPSWHTTMAVEPILLSNLRAVSYTHLTLPTILRV